MTDHLTAKQLRDLLATVPDDMPIVLDASDDGLSKAVTATVLEVAQNLDEDATSWYQGIFAPASRVRDRDVIGHPFTVVYITVNPANGHP